MSTDTKIDERLLWYFVGAKIGGHIEYMNCRHIDPDKISELQATVMEKLFGKLPPLSDYEEAMDLILEEAESAIAAGLSEVGLKEVPVTIEFLGGERKPDYTPSPEALAKDIRAIAKEKGLVATSRTALEGFGKWRRWYFSENNILQSPESGLDDIEALEYLEEILTDDDIFTA
jgi:hypothetical protein